MDPQPPPGSAGDAREEALLAKLRQFLARASRGLAEKALLLYVILKAGGVPGWAKAAILAALGYLILPLDTIPDPLPGLGLSDDLAILAALLVTLEHYATPELRRRAREMLDRL